jgi:hypothetical protein
LRALAFGEVVVVLGEPFTLEQRDHRVARESLHEVVAQAALVLPALRFLGLLVDQRHRNARHQHGLAAQQMGQLGHRQLAGFEILGVGPDAHRRALAAVALHSFTQL